jgi:hypothetical protein
MFSKKKAVFLLVLVLAVTLHGVTFESGEVSLNISGFLGIEGDYATAKYTPDMNAYYFGPSYSSLNFDFWVGTKFHTRFSFGVRPLFPNLYGASNLQWLPGVEAYGEYLPTSWFKIRLGQIIAPLGYLMPVHLNPTLYPMVGPPIFFDEETLPYSTAADVTFNIPLGKRVKLPITLYGGKPLYRAQARSYSGNEPDLNRYYQAGFRFGLDINREFQTGYSMLFSEGMLMRVYNGYLTFQNERFYAVAEAVSRTWGALGTNVATSEISFSVVFGVRINKVMPYLTYDYMNVAGQQRQYNIGGLGADIDLNDNLKWKIQGDYRAVDYDAAATNWNPRAFTVRSSLIFYFK